MTNEDTAWEQFSKADAGNIGDSSAQGMLQAIMAELNSVKADTARLAQKIDGAGAPPAEEEPMPMEAPADMMGGAPPMPEEGGAPPMDIPPAEAPAAEPPAEMPPAPMPDMGAPALGGILGGGMDMGGPEDETLSALQDALTQVTDPIAIAKLADIIKEYVETNYGAADAAPAEVAAPEAAAEEIPPEVADAIVEELLAGGEGEPMPAEGGDIAADLMGDEMDPLMKSENKDGVEEIGKEAKTVVAEQAETSTPGVQPDVAPTTSKITGNDAKPFKESEDEGEKKDEPEKEEEPEVKAEPESKADEEVEPALQINIFLGTEMEKVLNKNKEDGLTDDLPTEAFKVCDPVEPMKRSIDDLINQRMREKSGVDGKRYKISKSASERAADELQAIRKSIESFDAVKGMRVGDVLMTMQGLGKRGVTSIEKSYEPLIDEIVKYCDNNVGPQYTLPIFKSFGVDLDQLYEAVDTSAFTKTMKMKGGYNAPRAAEPTDIILSKIMSSPQLTDAEKKTLSELYPYLSDYGAATFQADKDFGMQPLPEALSWGVEGGKDAANIEQYLIDMGADEDDVTFDPSTETEEEYIDRVAPYIFAAKYAKDAGNEQAQKVYEVYHRFQPEYFAEGSKPGLEGVTDRANKILDMAKVENAAKYMGDLIGEPLTTRANPASGNYSLFTQNNEMTNRDTASNTDLLGRMLNDMGDGAFEYAPGKTLPAKEFLSQIPYNTGGYGSFVNMPNTVPGLFSSWKSPAMRIGDRYYTINGDNVDKYLVGELGRLGVDVKDTNVAAALEGLRSSDYKQRNSGISSLVGTINDLAKVGDASLAGVAKRMFADGKGYTGKMLTTGTPIDEIYELDSEGRPVMKKHVTDQIDAWLKPQVEYADKDSALAQLQATIGPLKEVREEQGVDPRSIRGRVIGGADSYTSSRKVPVYNRDNMPNPYSEYFENTDNFEQIEQLSDTGGLDDVRSPRDLEKKGLKTKKDFKKEKKEAEGGDSS